jgi:hypothetical protein
MEKHFAITSDQMSHQLLFSENRSAEAIWVNSRLRKESYHTSLRVVTWSILEDFWWQNFTTYKELCLGFEQYQLRGHSFLGRVKICLFVAYIMGPVSFDLKFSWKYSCHCLPVTVPLLF